MDLTADDIVEINQLYAAYNFAVDDCDGNGFVATFTPDGILVLPGGDAVTGADALSAFGSRERSMRHVANNIVIESNGEGARGRAYLQLYGIGKDGPKLQATGRYTDQLQPVDGQWRFARRVFEPDPQP